MKTEIIKAVGLGGVATLTLGGMIIATNDNVETAVASEVEEVASSESFVCADPLTQDENTLVASEYNKVAEADCMFVGCGGVF